MWYEEQQAGLSCHSTLSWIGFARLAKTPLIYLLVRNIRRAFCTVSRFCLVSCGGSVVTVCLQHGKAPQVKFASTAIHNTIIYYTAASSLDGAAESRFRGTSYGGYLLLYYYLPLLNLPNRSKSPATATIQQC